MKRITWLTAALSVYTSLSLARDLSIKGKHVSIPLPKGWVYVDSSNSESTRSFDVITIVPQVTANREGTTTICFSGIEPRALSGESPRRKIKSFKSGLQMLELQRSESFIAHYYFTCFVRQGSKVYAVLTVTAYDNTGIVREREDDFISIIRWLAGK